MSGPPSSPPPVPPQCRPPFYQSPAGGAHPLDLFKAYSELQGLQRASAGGERTPPALPGVTVGDPTPPQAPADSIGPPHRSTAGSGEASDAGHRQMGLDRGGAEIGSDAGTRGRIVEGLFVKGC